MSCLHFHVGGLLAVAVAVAVAVSLASCATPLPPLPELGKDYQTIPLCLALNFDPAKIKEYKRDFSPFGDLSKSEGFQAAIAKIVVEQKTKDELEKARLFERVVESQETNSADVVLAFYGRPESSKPSKGSPADFYGVLASASGESIDSIQFRYALVEGEPMRSLLRELVARQDLLRKHVPNKSSSE